MIILLWVSLNFFPSLNTYTLFCSVDMKSLSYKKRLCDELVISHRALAREGDYEMMSVCACVRACVS